MSPESKISILRDRAHMLSVVRSFFAQRNVLEVDTPFLGKAAPIDIHIDVMQIPLHGGERGFLHTSPEYAMKRLLALGMGDIYQLGHVFRDGEIGRLHNPEFTMIEWYRLGFPFDTMVEETLSLIRLFLGELPSQTLTYRQAFQKYANIDYLHATTDELLASASAHGLHLPKDAPTWDKQTILHFILGFVIEPHFQELTVLRDYPPSESALSRIIQRDDEAVALRYEIYYRGVELANGFEELTDATEQRGRFEEDNLERTRRGKNPLPIDEQFLQALPHLPDCCGVAVGFDRLMLLRHGKHSLHDIMPFSWEHV